MATTVRLATFNVENLFARWKFKTQQDPGKATADGWSVDQTQFAEFSLVDKKITGAAIKALDADVLALQEVEGVDTLKHFRTEFLDGRSAYPYVAGIDGNDPRLIDVAVLSRLPITHVRSYQHVPDPDDPDQLVFSRDCLEVGIALEENGPVVTTLFVNHLKSMLGGRAHTRLRRQHQAHAVNAATREADERRVRFYGRIAASGTANALGASAAVGDRFTRLVERSCRVRAR